MNLRTALLARSIAEFDFRNAWWGMSKWEVKHSEDALPQSEGEGYLTYRENVMGLDTVVGFHFLEGSLVEAGYAFREPFQTEHGYVKEYEKVKNILTGEYGEPKIDEDLGIAARPAGHLKDDDTLMYLSEWLTGRSIIRLILMGGENGYEFGVLHRSREHALIIAGNERMRGVN